jgi:hypothetical protein
MSKLMAVLLNGIAQIEYDRGRPVPEHQRARLDALDRKMDAGLTVNGRTIANPDPLQRAHVVASHLARAIKADDEALAAAMTTYLALRLPELKQVLIREEGVGFAIELDFDRDYVKQYPVSFGKPGQG